jgi:hypothetical protein
MGPIVRLVRQTESYPLGPSYIDDSRASSASVWTVQVTAGQDVRQSIAPSPNWNQRRVGVGAWDMP